jgi:hypothetical protein
MSCYPTSGLQLVKNLNPLNLTVKVGSFLAYANSAYLLTLPNPIKHQEFG